MKKTLLALALSLSCIAAGCGGPAATSQKADPAAKQDAAQAEKQDAAQDAAENTASGSEEILSLSAGQNAGQDTALSSDPGSRALSANSAGNTANDNTAGSNTAAGSTAAGSTANGSTGTTGAEASSALYKALADWQFEFCSGVGAWGTDVTFREDGTFEGTFHDSNLGESGEGYDATIYVSQFSGRLTNPVQTGETTWTASLEGLTYSEPEGKEEIAAEGNEKVRYVSSKAYGLDPGDKVEIYLPGTPTETLPEEYMSWIGMTHFMNYSGEDFIRDIPADLPFCGIFNPADEGYGFFSDPADENRNLAYLVNRGSFPGMKNVKAELHADGTYLYEDMDESGLRLVRNLCFRAPENFPSMYDKPQDFALAAVKQLLGGETPEDFYSYDSPEEGTSLNNYMYYVDSERACWAIFSTGHNEDTRSWTAKMLQSGNFVYVYGVSLSEYDEMMAGEPRSFFLSSLSMSGRPDRLSCATADDAASKIYACVRRDPSKKDAVLLKEMVWVSSGDDEAIRKYGLDPNDMPNDYDIVDAGTEARSAAFTADAACYVQLPGENSVRRQKSVPELLDYLDRYASSREGNGLLMNLILDGSGNIAFAFEPYTP